MKLIDCWWKCKNVGAALENSLIRMVYVELLYDLAILLQGIYPIEMKTYVHITTYTKMFIPTLLLIAKNWKWPKCPSTGQINETWYVHIIEYYLVIKLRKYWYVYEIDELENKRPHLVWFLWSETLEEANP